MLFVLRINVLILTWASLSGGHTTPMDTESPPTPHARHEVLLHRRSRHTTPAWPRGAGTTSPDLETRDGTQYRRSGIQETTGRYTEHYQPSDGQIDRPLEISSSSTPSTTHTPNSTVMDLPNCCEHHYHRCSYEKPYAPDDPGPSHGAKPDTAVCFLDTGGLGETREEGGAEEMEPKRCAQLDWCVLDVYHRAHACINGNLYRSPWHARSSVTICMYFPNDIWVRKSSAEMAVKVIFMLPIILVGVGANATILFILSRNRVLHTPVNLFVGNLALADLLLAAVCPTLFMMEDFYQHYVLGPIGCKLQGFTQTFLLMVSVLSLSMVCGERLSIVTGERLTMAATPYNCRLSTKQVIAVCCLVWVLAALVASPLVTYRHFVDHVWLDYEETFCFETEWITKQYWPFLVLVLIWIPMIFLVISYMIIFCKLDRHEVALRGRNHPIARRRRRRLLYLMFIILLVFLVCYTPFTVFLIVRAIVVKSSEEVDMYYNILWWMSHWLAFLNSAINPIIYGLTNEGFRKALCPMCSIFLPRCHASSDPDPPHRVQSQPASARHQNHPRTPLVLEALRGSSENFSEYPSYIHRASVYPTWDSDTATMNSMVF